MVNYQYNIERRSTFLNSYWKHLFLDNGDLSLIESGLQKYETNQINNYKVKHDIVFHIVLQGKGHHTVNDKNYELTTGDCFILKKNQHVYYYPNKDDPWTICWIGIGGAHLDTYLSNSMIPNVDVLTFKENSLAFEEMKQFIYFLSESDPNDLQDNLKTFSMLYHLLYSLNEEFPLTNHQNTNALSEPRLAEKIYSYIYKYFHSAFTVGDIAEEFNISRNYVFKLCKEHYGQSPKQIIQELRMNQASQLLRGSNSQVKEIASTVGYRDAFSFSKMFKEYYGYSPTQFRNLTEEEIDKALFIREEFLKV